MRYSLIGFIVCLFALPIQASADISAGEKLFQSTALGSNGKSCKSCHAQGAGLENLNDYDSEVLRGLINICVEDALKGSPFPAGAQELKDLEEYIRRLGHKKTEG